MTLHRRECRHRKFVNEETAQREGDRVCVRRFRVVECPSCGWVRWIFMTDKEAREVGL